MDLRSCLRHFDYLLLATVVALTAYGVTVIYFATRDDPLPRPTYYSGYQLTYAVVGLVLLVALSLVDYERFRRWQWLLYAFAVVSILAVFALGPVTRGSRRWLVLPFFNFQPSELALVIVTVALSAFLIDRLHLMGTRRVTVMALAYVALPALLVFAQPDFGTTMVFLVACLALLLFYGTPWTHFAALAGVFAVAVIGVFAVLPAVGVQLVRDYQMERLTVFLHPGHDPSGSGYNLAQSMIAVGSGGLRGRGDLATQTTLDFLPEHHTDFIFAVASERYGFVGAALLLALFAVLVWRALRIATVSRDLYGSMIAGGIAAMFLFEMLVNVGMTLGIMPITGIPLPFISYGGAALITNLMLVGLLESIHIRGRIAGATGGLRGIG
ncbi:MAG TPA: rod shape-determining protein RodA [Thermoleophilia bacterium]|nr:rod shape-determining protein RodA [Thermoleophilia bacterium]